MRALSNAELMNVWDRAVDRPAHERDLALLGAACPEDGAEALAHLSVGERDGLLLELRERTFGSRVTGLAACPGCGEQVELLFEVADIRAEAPAGRPDILHACR